MPYLTAVTRKEKIISVAIGVSVLTWALIQWAPRIQVGSKASENAVAVLNCEIINEDESIPFLTSAELYLSVKSSRIPDLAFIYPLNVGPNKGKRLPPAIETPFSHHPQTRETLSIELLDDDGLSEDEAELLANTLSIGTKAIIYGGNIYLISSGVSLPPGVGQAAEALLEMGARKISKDKIGKDFESLCSVDYEVPENPPSAQRDSNQLKLIEKNLIRDIERVRIGIHYQPPQKRLITP